MEYLIGIGLLGLGYKLQSDKNSKIKKNFTGIVPKNQNPSVDNVYTSKRAYNIFQDEQKKSNILLEKSKNPQDTNIITPGPSFPIIYNKVDYSDKTLPIEYNNYQKYDDITLEDNKIVKQQEFNQIKNNKNTPNTGGFNGISLTGDQIDPNTFTHNNMVPFFGGGVKQNLDEFSTRGIFENFTGTSDTYQKKQEQGLLFEPQKNMSNVYGTGSLDGFMLDRYQVSNIRSNETPIEKVYVGPGLNQGYTNQPSGGFQQADALDYAIPKTTDEIRVKTNPKISYYGRVISGEKINKPGKIGTIYKNKPDTFYIQEPDRYFTTTGQVIAAEQRPCIIAKYTNRKTTELKTRTGNAAPTNGTVAQVRSKYKISKKITYSDGGPRNVDKTGGWSILNMLGFAPNDYGKQSIKIRDNKRVLNNENDKGNVVNFRAEVEKGVARNQQKLKFTKKTNFIKNNRQNGNFQGNKKSKIYDPSDIARSTIKETNIYNNHSGMLSQNINKGVVYNPNNVTRTTIKETNIHNNHSGMMSNGMNKGVAYDPNDVTRTTIKETNIHNSHSGMMSNGMNKSIAYDPNDVTRTTIKETNIHNSHSGMMSNGINKGVAYDPNDVTRTTIKETNIHNSHSGMMSNGMNKSVVYDPNDVTRTTMKETTIHNSHSGMMSNMNKGVVYDPNHIAKTTMKQTVIKNKRKANVNNTGKSIYIKNGDKAKKTMKQTTIVNNAMGIASQMRGDGHLVKNIHIPETIREGTSIQYIGDASGPELGAYEVTDVNAPNTMRQFTSDIEYFGGAGNDGNEKPMSYEDIYNAEIKSIRGDIDREYTPGMMGPNEVVSSSDINVTSTKLGDIQNKYINERGVQVDKIYNSIPQMTHLEVTQDKERLDDTSIADRINGDILDAFRSNPYSQNLSSWA